MAGSLYCQRIIQNPQISEVWDTIQHILREQDIPGISGIDTRALTKILREKGTMNGMITTNGSFDLEEVKKRIRAL